MLFSMITTAYISITSTAFTTTIDHGFPEGRDSNPPAAPLRGFPPGFNLAGNSRG